MPRDGTGPDPASEPLRMSKGRKRDPHDGAGPFFCFGIPPAAMRLPSGLGEVEVHAVLEPALEAAQVDVGFLELVVHSLGCAALVDDA